MTTDRRDALIAAWLDDGPARLEPDDRRAIALLAERTAQRRGIVAQWEGRLPRWLGLRMPLAFAGATTVIVVALALVGPSLIATAPSESPATPSASSAPTDVAWDPTRWDGQPYPAPLRVEPTGGAPTVTTSPLTPAFGRSYDDGPEDEAPAKELVADLLGVTVRLGCWRNAKTACVGFQVPDSVSMPADPAASWAAYGLVIDVDGDGIGDIRVGFDNRVVGDTQMWRTDLRTGVTEVAPPGVGEDAWMDVTAPGPVNEAPHIFMTQSLTIPEFHFYAWAAVIQDGRVVSMDFAPDSGWIDGRPALP